MQVAHTAGRAWPEADRLFRSDDQWVGGDGAYSVPFGHDRVVWVFMDSLVCREPGAARTESTFINNSVAVQDGLDPASARMHFRWGPPDSRTGEPTAFFPARDDAYLWPGNLVVLGDTLMVSLMTVRTNPGGGPLGGFEVTGWIAALVENPGDDPDEWSVRYAVPSPSPHAGIFGTGGLQRDGDWLWAFALGRPEVGARLCRWAVEDVLAGNLDRREWWADGRWRDEASAATPQSFGPAQVEFSVHWDEGAGCWVWAQIEGLHEGELAVAFADRVQGPWSERRPVYRPPEADRPDTFVYGGKAHPELTGAGGDLVLSYNNNGTVGVEQVQGDPSIYYPSFVRVAVGAAGEDGDQA